jgi:hypothetical protein
MMNNDHVRIDQTTGIDPEICNGASGLNNDKAGGLIGVSGLYSQFRPKFKTLCNLSKLCTLSKH